jgi:hypothetical protein
MTHAVLNLREDTSRKEGKRWVRKERYASLSIGEGAVDDALSAGGEGVLT